MLGKTKLSNSKYQVGSYFRHIDTEVIFLLSEVKLDTYILVDRDGYEMGESLFTLEYDYELLKEGEILLYGSF